MEAPRNGSRFNDEYLALLLGAVVEAAVVSLDDQAKLRVAGRTLHKQPLLPLTYHFFLLGQCG